MHINVIMVKEACAQLESDTSGWKVDDSSNYRYWTSSPVSNHSDCIWRVAIFVSILANDASNVGNGSYGLRPVITIKLRSNIS